MLNGMGMNDLFDFDFEGGAPNGNASFPNEPWGDFMGSNN